MKVPHVYFIGDSDIARWPQDQTPANAVQTTFSGHSGATLSDILPHVRNCIHTRIITDAQVQPLYLVICAGENDLGKGISVQQTQQDFSALLNVIFQHERSRDLHLLFLGPKFEPWLTDSYQSRKHYQHLSNVFLHSCHNSSFASQITYLDCLTLFCGNKKSSLNKALPDPQYFDADQLHLSERGYQIWKELIDKHLVQAAQIKHE